MIYQQKFDFVLWEYFSVLICEPTFPAVALLLFSGIRISWNGTNHVHLFAEEISHPNFASIKLLDSHVNMSQHSAFIAEICEYCHRNALYLLFIVRTLVRGVCKRSWWRPCRMTDERRPSRTNSKLFIICRDCLCVSVIGSMSVPRVVCSGSRTGVGTCKGQY